MFRCITIAAGLAVLATTGCLAQNSANEQGRDIPGYFLPLPDDISPEMRPLVAAPPAPWDIHPKNIQEWKELVAKVAGPAKTLLPAMREKLGVQLEPITIAGVKAFVLTPRIITPENQNRVFLHFHGGAYVLNPGEPGTREATLMAAFGRAKSHLCGLSNEQSRLHIRPRSMTALLSTGSCSRPFRRKTSRSSAHQLAAG